MDMPAIDNLKQLYASGLLDAGEFTRLATELSQQSQNASHSGAGPSQLQQAEPAEEDEMLVDEDGIPLEQPSSARSSQHAPSSPEGSVVSFGRGCARNDSSPLSSLRGSPGFVGSAAASPADGPANWEFGKLVYSNDLKFNVTFIRFPPIRNQLCNPFLDE